MKQKAKLMDEKAIQRTLVRISHEIMEKNTGIHDVVIIGIKSRGVPLAQRIAKNIEKIEGVLPQVGVLDITMYRDDINKKVKNTDINDSNSNINFDVHFDIAGKNVILVDDVLYTGRTVRAALDALIDVGRPKTIQLAVLIDRGHRELPIRPDYIGKNVPTSKEEDIKVRISEIDEVNEVIIYE